MRSSSPLHSQEERKGANRRPTLSKLRACGELVLTELLSVLALAPILLESVPHASHDDTTGVQRSVANAPVAVAATRTDFVPPWAIGYESALDFSLSEWLGQNLVALLAASSDEDARIAALLQKYNAEVNALRAEWQILIDRWNATEAIEPLGPGRKSMQRLARKEEEFARLADRQLAMDADLLSHIGALAEPAHPREWLRVRSELDARFRPTYAVPYWSASPRLDTILEQELEQHPEGVTDSDGIEVAVAEYRRTTLAAWQNIRIHNIYLARMFWRLNVDAARVSDMHGANTASGPVGTIGRRSAELAARSLRAGTALDLANHVLLREARSRLSEKGYERVRHAFWKAVGITAVLDWWPVSVDLFYRDVLTVVGADDPRRATVDSVICSGYSAALSRFVDVCEDNKRDRLNSLAPDTLSLSQAERELGHAEIARSIARELTNMVLDARGLLDEDERCSVATPTFGP